MAMHSMALNKEMFQTHQVQVCETEVLFPNTVISIFFIEILSFLITHMPMIVIYYHILCNAYSNFDHDHRVCVYMPTNLLSLSRKLNENFVLILSSIVVNL